MSRPLTVAFACLALVLGGAVLAGCGDDDEDSGAGAAQTEATPAPAGDDTGGTPAGGEVAISMKDIKNIPMEAEAKVGQTVVWTNDDPFPHTVTAESGADFDSGNMEGGDTFEYKAEQAGEIAYVCKIHPNQKGTLTVTE
ncbi:MAG: cupredoxin domain-containing protein [Solirubrobacterales bacterium]|nr:cupredoxin domain-containing protein [Solirubrobacterales bacterium]